MTDMDKALSVVPVASANAITIGSGLWSDPTIWQGGRVPLAGDNFYIPSGTVTFDSQTPKLGWGRLANGATFDVLRTATSKLWTETFVTEMGSTLQIGTSGNPVTGSFQLLFADSGAINPTYDPWMISRQLIPMGTFIVYGQVAVAWFYNPDGTWSIINSSLPIDFASENTAISRRGAIMVMNANMSDLNYFSLTNLGRTDKSLVFTVPDGLGGGLTNPNGRYALHFHKNGGTLGGQRATVRGVRGFTSPGWGIVNHSSYVDCQDSFFTNAYGSNFVAEAGDEIGRFKNCAALGSGTHPPNTGAAETDADGRAVAGKPSDFGFLGNGFWLQSPAVELDSCVSDNQNNFDFFVNGTRKYDAGTYVQFPRSNLPDPTVTTMTTFDPKLVPCNTHDCKSGGHSFGGMGDWVLADQNNPLPPLKTQSQIKNCTFSGSLNAVFNGYSACIDFTSCIFKANGATPKVGSDDTGVNMSCNYYGCSSVGFPIALHAGTSGSCTISNLAYDGATGIRVTNARSKARTLTITGTSGPGQDVLLKCDASGGSLYQAATTYSTPLMVFTTNVAGGVNDWKDDVITINGTRAFFPEQSPNFPLSSIPSCPSFLSGLTNGQLWTQYGLVISGLLIPVDAVANNPKTNALFSPSNGLPTILPWLQVTKRAVGYGDNHQETDQASFSGHVLDSHGTTINFGPVSLNLGWNIVTVTAEGYTRGVWILRVATGTSFTAPW